MIKNTMGTGSTFLGTKMQGQMCLKIIVKKTWLLRCDWQEHNGYFCVNVGKSWSDLKEIIYETSGICKEFCDETDAESHGTHFKETVL